MCGGGITRLGALFSCSSVMACGALLVSSRYNLQILLGGITVNKLIGKIVISCWAGWQFNHVSSFSEAVLIRKNRFCRKNTQLTPASMANDQESGWSSVEERGRALYGTTF